MVRCNFNKKERALGNVKKSKSRLIDAIDTKKLKKNSNLLQGTLGSKIYVTLNFFYISLRTQWGDIVSEEAFLFVIKAS